MRKCGTCSACCRWPSVEEIDKPPRVPCQHLHKQGFRCTVYADRPQACAAYRCSWLRGIGGTKDRPDTCKVLIDRRSTQFGVVLVAKPLTPGAAMSPKGRSAIERATRCLVMSEDDDERVIGAVGPPEFMKEVMSKGPDIRLGGQRDWITNIVVAARKGRVYPGLDHDG